jgi:hypothetical protein
MLERQEFDRVDLACQFEIEAILSSIRAYSATSLGASLLMLEELIRSTEAQLTRLAPGRVAVIYPLSVDFEFFRPIEFINLRLRM